MGAGAITPLGRRREIYGICREYNILILEDDPYYYLQFSTAHGGEPKGLTDLGRSYLSMDTDSRVIRLDSFSKARSCVLSTPFLPAVVVPAMTGSSVLSGGGLVCTAEESTLVCCDDSAHAHTTRFSCLAPAKHSWRYRGLGCFGAD